MTIEVHGEDDMLGDKLTRLLEDAGQACIGLNGQQAVKLLGSLAAHAEAAIVMSVPLEDREGVRRYVAAARQQAYLTPLFTLDAALQAQA